jgi:hypothetical protein
MPCCSWSMFSCSCPPGRRSPVWRAASSTLVPLHHPCRTVKERRAPGRIVTRVAAPVIDGKALGLQLAFVDHPKPVGVAQIAAVSVPLWMMRAKSGRASQVPWAMISPVAASSGPLSRAGRAL